MHHAHIVLRIALCVFVASPAPARSGSAIHAPADLPTVTVTQDDTEITESCVVVIPEGTIIPDKAGDGVIQIRTDGITVEFHTGPDGSPNPLAGAVIDDNWDALTGIGVRVENAAGVTLRNLRVLGYKVGVLATHADGLTVESADLSDNYRQRLRSTPLREDPTDWLYPHENDDREWVTKHGSALCIERSENIPVRALRVRRGQNGIILDRVNKSQIYDNDCSFLSGWGLACWRSNENLISRNAFDFCVRGHSEGVYNRGQDSAGILFFEQCNRNTVVENSATHSGDGFFGFAGREAIGEVPHNDKTVYLDGGSFYDNRGCNNNGFSGNDFSYAPAHGWEMTFSEGNGLVENRIVENGICGVWGGYSSMTTMQRNHFEGNGTLAYGNEGGAINIEHGSYNHIRWNTFVNNSVVARFWWDDDGALFDLPGTPSRDEPLKENAVLDNTVRVDESHPFTMDHHTETKFRYCWLQDPTGTRLEGTVIRPLRTEIATDRWIGHEFEPGTEPTLHDADVNMAINGMYAGRGEATGTTRPVGARDHLRGRHNIIMGKWGPWDHESPMIRVRERTASRHVYEVFGVQGESLNAGVTQPSRGTATRFVPDRDAPAPDRWTATIESTEPGVHPYEMTLADPETGFTRTLTGTLVHTTWHARTWAWTADPLTDLDAWRAEAEGDRVVHTDLDALDFYYQSRGPVDLGMLEAEAATNAGIGRDAFATIATTTVPLTAGRWHLRTVSDDGIRVFVDGEVVIERWNIHGPTPDEAVITLDAARTVAIKVEHFEKDGWAALQVTLEPAD